MTRTWLLLLAAVAATGQLDPSRPDFSGRWELVFPAGSGSDVALELTVTLVPRGGAIETMTVARRFQSKTESSSYALGSTGGTVGGVAAGGSARPRSTSFSNAWRGDTIVLQQGEYSGEPRTVTEHEEEWSLDTRDTLRIRITDRGSAEGQVTSVLIYRRLPR